MEDDAGKSIHDGFKDSSKGTTLRRFKSQRHAPDRNRDRALTFSNSCVGSLLRFLTERQLSRSSNMSRSRAASMERGQLRCDANVSVRLRGAEKLGTKAEVKNLNSFRFLKMALDHEIERQVDLIETGGRVTQETRLFNVETVARTKPCAARKTQ